MNSSLVSEEIICYPESQHRGFSVNRHATSMNEAERAHPSSAFGNHSLWIFARPQTALKIETAFHKSLNVIYAPARNKANLFSLIGLHTPGMAPWVSRGRFITGTE